MPSIACLLRLLLGTLIVCFLGVGPAASAPSPPPSSLNTLLTDPVGGANSDTSDAPSVDPYATDRSIAYHVLATPAYVLHGVTRPLGWAVTYVEQEFPELFEGKEPPRGGFPLMEFGGSAGFLGGLMLYDNQLFGSTHEASVQGLYGGPETFRVGGQYRIPSPFGPRTSVSVRTSWISDPEDIFFRGGNDSALETDGWPFSRNQFDLTGSFSYAPTAVFAGQLDVLFEHVEVTTTEPPLDGSTPGLASVNFLTSRAAFLLNLTRGQPRTYLGTEVLLQLDYTHDLTSGRFQYGRYVAELRQYFPLGVLPNSRRLALRARLEQVEPLLGGTAIPFYHLPHLGGQMSPRGFRYRRFQNEGALVVTAEYRYPIWENLDAVVFVDAGQVFDTPRQVAADRFHWSYGGGIHLLNQRGLSFRVEVAGSSEGIRTVMTTEPTFRKIARWLTP